jgi:hypothetical protein
MANNNIAVDKFLDPNSSNLLPVDASYVDYRYEKITSSTNPADWTEGKRAEFILPEYENSVYDTDEGLYIDCTAEIKLIPNEASGTYQGGRPDNNISALATVAIEQFFTAGLIDDIDVSVGGVSLKNYDAPANLYPYLQSMFILSNDLQRPSSKGGNSRITPVLHGVTEDTPQKVGLAIRGLSSEKGNDVFNDTKNPFHMSLDKTITGKAGSIAVIDFQDTTFKYNSANLTYPSSYIYRNCQTTPEKLSNIGGTSTAEPPPHEIRFLMKISEGYLSSHWRKPANLKHRIALTRSRDIRYALCGSGSADKYASNFVADGRNDLVTYILKFSKMDMYIKRLTLSEAQLSLYRTLPLLEMDIQRWSAQAFNINSSGTLNQLTNWTKTPEILYIGVRLTDFISPPPLITDYGKVTSMHSAPQQSTINVSSLYINSTYGTIPAERYIFEPKAGEVSITSDVRAYEDFIKTCAGYPHDVIDYQTWRSNFRWYGFTLNSSQANPYTEVPLPSRSNVNIVASFSGSGDVTKYSLVCIAMYRGKLGVANMKSVFMTI